MVFVPRRLRRRMEGDAFATTGLGVATVRPYQEECADAAVVLVDLSNFTSASAYLCARGDEGMEQLLRHLMYCSA